MQIGYDNCKDCAFHCEHAGKDREFVYSVSKGSCKTKRPKADLVAVVRCRECKHSYRDKYGYLECSELVAMRNPGDNDYCSRGECCDQSVGVCKMEGSHEEP